MAKRYRSAIDGRYCTKAYAMAHPESTVAESVHPLLAVVARVKAALTTR